MGKLLDRIVRAFDETTQSKRINRNDLNLYQRVYVIIKNAILNNDIPDESTLPPTRTLAKCLALSRSTIIRAYELLLTDGIIQSKAGSGYVVKQVVNPANIKYTSPNDDFGYPDLSETAKSFKKNLTLISSNDHRGIAFTPGVPPLDVFPINQWKSLSNGYWRYIKTSALSYSASTGIRQLKKILANYLNFSRNIKCDPQQIFIVSGSLQSLYLIGSVVINPGECVTIENPTFPNVISVFRGLRANLQTISVDDKGLRVQDLTEPGHIQSKLLHTTPSCQYPTGVSLSMDRRMSLLEWANKNKVFIIENDYEHEVNNYKNDIAPLYNLDKEQRVIFLSTFNRLLHPSIRVGYMVVPPYLIDAIEILLKHSHRFVPSSTQVILSQFIEKNHLFNHVKRVIAVAEERRSIFMENFVERFGDIININSSKMQSLHILGKLNCSVNDKELINKLAQNNIVAHPYSKCFANEEFQSGLILGYSPVRETIMKEKISQMEQIIKATT